MKAAFVVLLLVVAASVEAKSKRLVTLNETTWTDLLKGEWMVEFHAPWCPACKDLQKAWNAFADMSRDIGIKVAEVDVTINPGLSGRFLVTALPTIYHVKDGVFRFYSGPRDKNEFIAFVEEKKWSLIEPVPSYKHPNSAQMGVVAVFFKLSMAVRDMHNHMVEKVGVPAWASYLVFAGITLALGCVLGVIIVMVIDSVFPTVCGTPSPKKAQKNAGKTEKDNNSQASQDEASSSEDGARSRKGGEAKKQQASSPKSEGKKKK
uniref:Thioredoxin-related transmembrane protein 1 n=1 Tax=Steinernema glaseri TaxID=37863 RepID=A0A1I8AGQ5_9BILA